MKVKPDIQKPFELVGCLHPRPTTNRLTIVSKCFPLSSRGRTLHRRLPRALRKARACPARQEAAGREKLLRRHPTPVVRPGTRVHRGVAPKVGPTPPRGRLSRSKEAESYGRQSGRAAAEESEEVLTTADAVHCDRRVNAANMKIPKEVRALFCEQFGRVLTGFWVAGSVPYLCAGVLLWQVPPKARGRSAPGREGDPADLLHLQQ